MSKNKKAITLSLIIPAYNEEDYLADCLKFVALQTVTPIEVIVVDNGSDDNTVKVTKQFPFVTLLYEPQRGVTFARNKGFKAATGDIIGRIDADTHLPSNWVETVLGLFNADPMMAAVSGPSAFYDLPFPRYNLLLNKIIRTSLYYSGAKEERYLFGSNMAIRNDAWRAVASNTCTDFGIHEDNDLAIHLDTQGFIVRYTNKLTIGMSVRRANITPAVAWKYSFMQYTTFRHHHTFSLAAVFAGITLILSYPVLYILHRTFDPQKRRFSLKRTFLFNQEQRKLPMD
jgi:glycosyltransferase involved in cell wall biosynthesis